MEKRISIVIAGEKDHGKSTLLGRLLYDTGSLPKDRRRFIQKIKQATGLYAWSDLLDTLNYEKKSGMTLDTTRVWIRTKSEIYEFLDTPGHKELIKNMASGAAEAQYALIIVDALEGITAQTLTHIKLIHLLGVKKFVVLINKCDLIGFSKLKFERIKKAILTRLKRSGLGPVLVIPISAQAGENLTTRSGKLSWFSGPTLIKLVEKKFCRPTKFYFNTSCLIAVQDIYTNQVAAGKVLRGAVKTNSKVFLYPQKSKHKVKNIFLNSKKVASANAEDNIGLTLLPKPASLKRGDLIATRPIKMSGEIKSTCFFLKSPGKKKLFLESGFKETPIFNFEGLSTDNFARVKIRLREEIFTPKRFVIKTENEIIGICRRF
jgi:bifunctional enzyme CysN/CysC